MADRRSWFERARDVVKRALGIEGGEETPIPQPLDVPIPVQPETPPPQGPPPSRGGPPFLPRSGENQPGRTNERDRIEYHERAKYTLPRWGVGDEDTPPSVHELDRLVRASTRRNTSDYYTFVVTGRASKDSPKRGRQRDIAEPITLAFVKTKEDVDDAFEHATNAEEFMSWLTGGIEDLEWYEVHNVSIIDR